MYSDTILKVMPKTAFIKAQNLTLFVFLFFLLVSSLPVHSQTITVNSITTSRQTGGDQGYTLDGQWMSASSRLKLLKPKNFGVAGIYPKPVKIVDGFGLTGSLRDVTKLPKEDLFFIGTFNRLDPTLKQFTDAEIDSLYNWSIRGGKLIITPGFVILQNNMQTDFLSAKWTYSTVLATSISTVLPTQAGNTTTLFNGPFGNVTGASQGAGAQGYFQSTATDVKVLGVDQAGRPTLYLDCKTLDLLIADVDVYTDIPRGGSFPGVSSGDSIMVNNNNDKFWANTIVFMDKLQSPPVLIKNNTIMSVKADYLSYTWYKNGTAVSGAISHSLAIDTTNSSQYHVEVTVNGGCMAKSNTLSIVASTIAVVTPTLIAPNYNDCDYFVPSAFSPNFDGINDYASVYGCFENVNFRIFDRWGELVFETNKANDGWDGLYKGKEVVSGVYVWTLTGIKLNGERVNTKGNLTLIR